MAMVFRFPLADLIDAGIPWRRVEAGALPSRVAALEGATVASSCGASRPSPAAPLRYERFHLLFGVALPLLALALEWFTRTSARLYLDPLPGPGWLALAMMAPLANLLVIRRPSVDSRLVLGANGLALAVSAVYSALYLPVLPLAVLGLLFGVGLLPLAPFFALFTALLLRRQVMKRAVM